MRRLLAAIVLMLSACPAAAYDLPGHDYANFDAPTVFTCRNSCGGDRNCLAFTWIRPGYQGPKGRCWLKNAVPPAVGGPCCQSGTHRDMLPSVMRPETGIDRPGGDYKNFNVSSPSECEANCGAESHCRAWTFLNKGVQGPSARCVLKAEIPPPVLNPKSVSGVKFMGAWVPFD